MPDMPRKMLFLPDCSPTDIQAGDEIIWFPDEKKIELVRPDPSGGKAAVLGIKDEEGQIRPYSEMFRKAAPTANFDEISPDKFQIGAEYVLFTFGIKLKPMLQSSNVPEGVFVFRLVDSTGEDL